MDDDERIFGERYEDLVAGMGVLKGLELDDDGTLRLRQPLDLRQPEVWALGRAVRRAAATRPDGMHVWGPSPESGLQIVNQRQFEAYVLVYQEVMRLAVPRIPEAVRRPDDA